MNDDKINQYINTHPRECLFMLLTGLGLIWQTVPTLLGMLVYLIGIKKYQFSRMLILIAGIILLLMDVYFTSNEGNISAVLVEFVKTTFHYNKLAMLNLFANDPLNALQIFYRYLFTHTLSITFFLAGGFGLIDLIPKSPHADALNALQQGKIRKSRKEISEIKIKALLDKLPSTMKQYIVLGVSKYSGACIAVPEKNINQVALVLGTTGSGKTITLRRFYDYAVNAGRPLIIIDGKPDDDNIDWLIKLAKQHDKPFYGFNCGNFKHYDPLTHGGHTELKDKIISLKDQWESDYYRSIAEDYLQVTFEVLLHQNKAIDLGQVVNCLNYANLRELVRRTQNVELSKRVESLDQYEKKDIAGLQAHFNILVHSELGKYFLQDDSAFRLKQVIENDGVVYFALPALRFPSFSKVLEGRKPPIKSLTSDEEIEYKTLLSS